eukprot:6491398-Amphidinium_carterae.1
MDSFSETASAAKAAYALLLEAARSRAMTIAWQSICSCSCLQQGDVQLTRHFWTKSCWCGWNLSCSVL